MKKVLAIAIGLLSMLGGAVGVALAAPGPNGHNNHGLCTALFNGSQNGQSHKQSAPPFATLIANSPDGPTDSDDQGGSITDAWDWCQSTTTVGGQPDNPGTAANEGNGKNARGKG